MKAKALIRFQIDTGRDGIRCAQWIAEEVRDYASTILGVYEAEIVKVEEADGEAG